jgi:ribosomal-protein-alanine N-acetyltransferase
MRLRTPRLELRPLPPAAAAALPVDRDRAARLIGATLPAEWPQSDLLDVLPIQAAASPEEAHFRVWVIVEPATSMVVGDVGFLGPPGADGRIELGYSVVPACRRRGYASEAARALLAWACHHTRVQEIVAGCDRDNEASRRTLHRLGFSLTGERGGELRWRYDSVCAPSASTSVVTQH